jgi:hypothetical protein
VTTDDDTERERIDVLLRALDDGPGSRYRKFVALQIYCRRCDHLVVEVVNLSPERVIRYWPTLLTATGAHRPRTWIRLPPHRPDDAGRILVASVCECATHEVWIGDLYDALESRHRRVAVDPSY